MSSRRGGNKFANAGPSDPSTKGKNVADMSINQGLAGMNLDDGQGGVGWKVFSNKSKTNTGNFRGKQWPHQQNSGGKAWGNQDTAQKLGIRGGAGPLREGNNWHSLNIGNGKNDKEIHIDEDDDDDEFLEDSDDDILSDNYDSDASQKSLIANGKQNKWFKKMFQCIDSLSIEKASAPERQWHCPACKGGPGATAWFNGLQAVIIHARNKGSKRVKLHRELARLLDDELGNRGASSVLAGKFFGMWVTPGGVDKEIVWPPMVIIRNTQYEKDESGKWIGMGNQELLEYFSGYDASKARHSYGPQGHRGISALIFEATTVGYLEAGRLNDNFKENGAGRAAWERVGVAAFCPGGKRQLFGYLAEKKDLDFFNQHSQGKSRLKFEMKSHEETVVKPFKQMGEHNQQLLRFQQKLAESQRRSKALEETNDILGGKLRKNLEENQIVRERTKLHHEQIKEEMDYQESFFKEHLFKKQEERNKQEENFYKMQQKIYRGEDVQNILRSRDKEMVEAFVAARDRLMEAHEEQKMELMKKYRWEEIALEEEYGTKLDALIEQYIPAMHHPNTDF